MRRRALLDWLDLDRARAEPLQEQMAQQLRNAIMQGEMPSGMALPSSRSLAKDLGVSRGTVTAVYDRLLGESLLEVRGGRRPS
jgi:GntR family transcriptional regulator/MocR family aminotransferase